ncbi:MAG: hypothetical protein WC667_07120 [Sulfurimonas sp.]
MFKTKKHYFFKINCYISGNGVVIDYTNLTFRTVVILYMFDFVQSRKGCGNDKKDG